MHYYKLVIAELYLLSGPLTLLAALLLGGSEVYSWLSFSLLHRISKSLLPLANIPMYTDLAHATPKPNQATKLNQPSQTVETVSGHLSLPSSPFSLLIGLAAPPHLPAATHFTGNKILA